MDRGGGKAGCRACRASLLLILVPTLICVQGCGRAGAGAVAPASRPGVESQLAARLQDELGRLGIDPAKAGASAPLGEDNAVFDLAVAVLDADGPGGAAPNGLRLAWTERLLGDYDQNSEVNAADLSALAAHFLGSVDYDDPLLHDGFAFWPSGEPDGAGRENWRLSRIDGDGNGELFLPDVTAIAQHWKQQLSGYVIERAINLGTGELVWQPLDLGNGAAPSVAHAATEPASGAARYFVELPIGDAARSQKFRVRPYDMATAQQGESSNVATYFPDSAGDTTPPYWTGPVGLQSAVPANGRVTLGFGTAEDDQSPPVAYRIYWAPGDPAQPGAPFDYAGAQSVVVAAAPRTLEGLTNGQYYRFAVRALDSAQPANLESNSAVLGATPTAADVYPPEWPGHAGVRDVIYGFDEAVVAWEEAVDEHVEGPQQWASGPVTYRLYYGSGTVPDLAHCQSVDYADDPATPGGAAYLAGLDTSQPHWFMLRARDAASPPNEDGNTAVRIVPGLATQRLELPARSPALPAAAELDLSETTFVTDPQRSAAMYVQTYRIPGGDIWLSAWQLGADNGFSHVLDQNLGPAQSNFRYLALELDGQQRLRVLFERDATVGQGNLWRYEQATGVLDELPLPEMNVASAVFDLAGQPCVIFNRLVSVVPFAIEFYNGRAPFASPALFWEYPNAADTRLDLADRPVLLESGGIAFRAQLSTGDGNIPSTAEMVLTPAGTLDSMTEFPVPADGAALSKLAGRNLGSALRIYRASQPSTLWRLACPAGQVEFAPDEVFNSVSFGADSVGDFEHYAVALRLESASWLGAAPPVNEVEALRLRHGALELTVKAESLAQAQEDVNSYLELLEDGRLIYEMHLPMSGPATDYYVTTLLP